ncbi:ribonuclease P protein component [Evansella clarkii]|jgi:ribonuclease P protein component|uniref:ribonuclease P protein component n=1 Tax=Evansella clarkii TaxID=79879 RepID=UPI000B42F5CF|nr:ribonuclease P protein component [Evansella clarkii]
MKKTNRLKKNEEFQKVFQQGTSVANRQFVVYFLDKEEQTNIRIGLSVSKKLGNAVKRNKIKRLLREGLREFLPEMNSNLDLIIIARKPAAEMELEEIRKSLRHVLHKGRLLQKYNRRR